MSEYQKNYAKTPKGKYIRQRANSHTRGIEWLFTFESWWKIWEESGKWEERGTGPGQFYMCRKGDIGPYAPWNVDIKSHSENSKEMWEVKKAKAQRALTEEEKWAPYPRKTAWDYPHENLDRWRKERGLE